MHLRERCRKCNAPIVFILTAKGRRMPIDAATFKVGDKVFDHTRHMSHFATCPYAEQFRRRKPGS
jgi:hypothetical protein